MKPHGFIKNKFRGEKIMKKRTLIMASVILLLATPVAMLSAGGARQGETQKTVAGVVFQEDQFMRLHSMGFEDAAKEAGFRFLSANTNNDAAREAELINTYVEQKIAGVAIAPISEASSIATLRRASDAGLKVAITNTGLNDASFVVGGYTSDNYNLGETTGTAAAAFIRDKLGGRAKIAILEFRSQLPEQSKARVDGFIDAVRKVNPNVEIIPTQDAWLQDQAVQRAGDILTANPDVNIIYGANDGGTIGSVMAVKNAGLAGKCFVFGIDTGDQQIAMLRDRDNVLQAVTGQDAYGIAYKAMQVLIDAINGKDVSATQGKAIIVPGLLVSRDNPRAIDDFEKELAAKLAR
jgi:simple sugar transport system substrate-binding protein/ribose transport system substrate-binding protein